MKEGGLDFRTGEKIEMQSYFEESMDIHHIFPKAWCEKHNIPRGLYDSIINKTALSATTNRKIGGRAPSQYLPTLERSAEIGPDKMDCILGSHLIDVKAIRSDDFSRFFQLRMEALLVKIEGALGKPVLRDEVDLGSIPEVTNEEDIQTESEIIARAMKESKGYLRAIKWLFVMVRESSMTVKVHYCNAG